MDDLGKTLMLLFVMILTASIIGVVVYEYKTKEQRLNILNYWNEAGVDFKSGQFGEAFVEGCLKGGDGLVSKEHCECCYDFLRDNYSIEELRYIMLRFFEEGYSPALKDAEKACVDKI